MFSKVLLTALAFVAFGLTKFAFNILVFRWYSPTFLGEINQVLSVFLLVPLFYAPGLGTVVSKFAAEFLGSNAPHKSQQVFSLSLILVAVASLVCLAATVALFPHLAGTVKADQTTLVALAPMLPLYSLYAFLRTSYYGFDRVRCYLRNEIVSSVAFFGMLGAGLVTQQRLLVLLPFASHSALFVAIALADLRDQFRFRALLAGIAQDLRRYTHFFFCTIINSLAGPGAFHLGIVLTGRLTGDRDLVGYYSLLLYALQPLNLLPMALLTVLMPTISRHHGAKQTAAGVELSERAFRPLFLVMTLIWGCGMILGWEAIEVISGRADSRLLVAFEVVFFGLYLYLISTGPGVLLNATEYIGVIAVGGAVSIVLAIATWWTTLPAYGLLGGVAGYGVLQVVKAVWSFIGARRIFQWRAGVARDAMVTVPAVVAVGLFSLLVSRSRPFHIAIAVAFVGLFLAFYVRTIKTFADKLIAEARAYATRT